MAEQKYVAVGEDKDVAAEGSDVVDVEQLLPALECPYPILELFIVFLFI